MMSTSNKPGPQVNADPERKVNENHASEPDVRESGGAKHHNGLPTAEGARAANGVNGIHHSTPEEVTTQEVEEQEVETQEASASELSVDAVDDADALADGDVANVADVDIEEAAGDAEPIEEDAEAATATAELRTPRSAVKIKGRPGGVALELGDGEWDELMLLLEERLRAAEGFFRGGRVLLDVGTRPLGEEHLQQVRALLDTHEMQLAVVRATADETLQVAADAGMATTNEDTHESLHVPEPPLIVPDGPPNAYTPSTYAPPPKAAVGRPNHFVHRGSLRSGQVLRKTESIVVIGDVNPGAQVVSGGDVMVWGRLRGIAHAGAEGNRRAVVAAIDFVPTQLRIANLTAIAPERKKSRGGGLFFWKKEPERGPEIARVTDGRIVVEPWDEDKPNGLGMWRDK